MKKEHYVLIMAGGEGERFWPYSTPDFPKQFLALFDKVTMIEKTYNRMLKLVPEENIFISTNERFIELTKKFLPRIDEKQIIAEPQKRNTFPAMALFISTLIKRGLNGTIIMVAADHIIENEDNFINTCNNGFKIAEEKEKIVTFGIIPTRVETNYGYLHPEKKEYYHNIEIYENVSFIEKPDFNRAKQFYESGEYFWNSGIFTFSINTLMREIKNIIPNDYALINSFLNNRLSEEQFFKSLTKNSIDYVIMEKSPNISMLKSNFKWDDIGNWDALLRFSENNFIRGNINFNHLNNSIIISENYCVEGDTFENIVFIEKNHNFLISTLKGLPLIKKGLKEKKVEKKPIHLENCNNIKFKNFNKNTLILGLNNIRIELQKNSVIKLKTLEI